MNLPLHPGDLRELVERRDVWDDVTEVDLSVQHLHGPYPTLHAIGLGPQLAELERICAEAQRCKHAGESIRDHEAAYHLNKALTHLSPKSGRDPETGALHIVHAAARLLMAAACLDGAES